ncbi:MAG TPA: SCO family protein [Candidatus Acidoferrales bacterium]|nr:SCO family protein [Candidatus Acidoferrales bacterium]
MRLSLALAALVCTLSACAPRPSSPDFTLTDQAGRPWTLSDQRGHVVVLNFGFTHCEDTCPLTLAKLVRVVRSLGPRAADVTIAFVSVDPARDTPAVMRRYVAKFDTTGRLVGLTGSPAAVTRTEDAYHVWAQRVPGPRSGNYDVAHSAVIYFIDRSGAQRKVLDDDTPEAALGGTLRELL